MSVSRSPLQHGSSEEQIRNARSELHDESARLQIQGRSLSDEEKARVDACDRAVTLLDEALAILQGTLQGVADADLRPMEVVTEDAVAAGKDFPSSASETERSVFAGVIALIRSHGEQLKNVPGVVSVRPGYRFAGGGFTGTPAIVVAVLRKRSADNIPSGERIPRLINGVQIDVTEATPEEQLRARAGDNQIAAESLSSLEKRGATDKTAEDAVAEWERILSGEVVGAEDLEQLAAELPTRYRPPQDLSLTEATVDSITCHVSPDAGWSELENFLGGVEERLTVAMYDFHAEHVRDALKSAMEQGGGNLRLILDKDGGTPDIEKQFLARSDSCTSRYVSSLGDLILYRAVISIHPIPGANYAPPFTSSQ